MNAHNPSMHPDPARESTLFQAAAQLAGEAREAFLDGACHGDPALRQRLEALLAAHAQSEGVLAEPGPVARQTMKLELTDAPDVGPFAYARRDQPVRPFRKAELVSGLMAAPPVALAGVRIVQINDMDGVKYILEDNGWLLIRPSGTEPVLRIYAESRDDASVAQLLLEGAALATSQIDRLYAQGSQIEGSPSMAHATANGAPVGHAA